MEQFFQKAIYSALNTCCTEMQLSLDEIYEDVENEVEEFKKECIGLENFITDKKIEQTEIDIENLEAEIENQQRMCAIRLLNYCRR